MRFIGCKTLLLNNIKEVIIDNNIKANSFCDIFSGTSTVARFFKKDYEIISNDLLYFSYVLQRGSVGINKTLNFKILNEKKGINDPIKYFNEISDIELETMPVEKRFLQNTYAPKGGRMYFTDKNALRIDFSRYTVENWYKQKILNEDEYYYLIACIVEGVPFVSNISGTYGAFHKTWDKRTEKVYQLIRLETFDNKKNNCCFNIDGVELLKNISGDILYVDPPYNSRQYLPNYHVLETVAKYDYPEVRGVTAQRPYENQKSDFCMKKTVLNAFENLINNAKFKHIILSYSTDGLMSTTDIENIMKKYGKASTFKIYEIPYRRYKSREQKEKEKLKELLIYIEK